MSFYARRVLPHIINLAMKNKDLTRLRGAWVPQARGEVLEVGIGSGLNLPFYSSEVARVYGIEPSVALQEMARRRAAVGRTKVEFLSQSAEEVLPLADKSVDTIVMTWTLCSIPDAPRALAQMKRVLKADGRLLFIEHGRSPDAGVVAWQDRLTPVQRRLAGEILGRIEARGFDVRAGKLVTASRALGEEHYAEHKEKPFYGELVDFITSGPLVAMVLEGPEAVKAARQVIGSTNPLEAATGSIRGDFAIETGQNMVHGSDSPESAAREAELFFGEL